MLRVCLRVVPGIALVGIGGLVAGLAPSARAGEVAGSVREAEAARVATIARIAPAVLAVFQRSTPGGGSGVLITHDGYALTNFHVAGEDQFFKCGLNDGNLYDAVLVGVDPTGDVALIKLQGRDDFPVAAWGDSDAVRVGDWVYVLGNPFLLASDFQPTTTYGIVSGVHRYQYPANTILEYTDCLQVDASVNPGNSGGPLFNKAGELIGINGRISVAQRGRVNAGAGYSISINQVRNFLGYLHSGRIVDHASLGATFSTDSHGAIVVSQIQEESDAYRRGLRVDDELVAFAGRPIRSVNQFKNILGIFPEEWKVPLTYQRDGAKHDIRVRLRPLHGRRELAEMMVAPEKPAQRPPERSPDQAPKPGPKDRPPRERRRNPPRALQMPKPAEVPEKLKALFVHRAGFANYYFNRLELERVLHGLDSWGAYPNRSSWTISGTTAAGAPFECVLANAFASLETGGKPFLQQLDQEPQDEPTGTGGLLTALNQLRLLLTQREKGFTAFVYFGTEPLDGGKETVDVLVSALGSVESRWYFDASTGALAGFDTTLLEDTDPCEVRIRDVALFEGIHFPTQILVRHGDTDYALFRVLHAKERK
ncbi:MAG TPA: trypsin-like peptidase domain-containing protein [Planctomycetaceae bacterium]|jgi:S1-C subfamily serine protease|nr:trypsin-like peptidase domain-containing protein [Planctomycetaceae bacterium]